ncbi:hypothetical protein MMC97_03500 [Clostridioides difficile]|nr:hypothetical protein [Clostridioides difficile]MBY2543959.1 hypothetical protein [Clostridioides difficile]MBY2706209.1 hypothetical protein [Clostridioides difficile]MBZ1151549.1 hypothetical protein [Clostridioides difficile]MCH7239532.1 hypothetical protein [Clostridioides difficile]
MGILEGATKIRDIAKRIAIEKKITEQEAWDDAIKSLTMQVLVFNLSSILRTCDIIYVSPY